MWLTTYVHISANQCPVKVSAQTWLFSWIKKTIFINPALVYVIPWWTSRQGIQRTSATLTRCNISVVTQHSWRLFRVTHCSLELLSLLMASGKHKAHRNTFHCWGTPTYPKRWITKRIKSSPFRHRWHTEWFLVRRVADCLQSSLAQSLVGVYVLWSERNNCRTVALKLSCFD